VLWISVAGAQTKSYVPPKTVDGQPDISGIWTNQTITPLERPPELAGKATFTPQEAVEWEKKQVATNNADRRDLPPDQDVSKAYNDAWWDRGTKVVGTLRTSLIVDPPDGRVPPLTAAAQKKQADQRAYARLHPADGPEDRALSERCIQWPTAGPPMMPSFYNNNYQIFQGPGYVAIVIEMIHDVRIIPIDGRPHVAANIQQWLGDARGHWEGNTLVVETTNFNDKRNFQGSSENMRLIERFTRVAADTLVYEYTVDDPATFTKQWTVRLPMAKNPEPIYEYACHEGNYGLAGSLSGARAEEKAAAAKK